MIRTRPTDFINRRVGARFPNYSNLAQGITSRVNPPGQGPNFLSGSAYPGLTATAQPAPAAPSNSPQSYLSGWKNNLWSMTPESIAFAGLGINPSGEMYNVGRPSFTPSASTLPTDYNPSSQMYWMAPGYQSRPKTETQQRLLNSPIYEAGPNLSQEGKDVAALWGIDLSEKPEGWKFRPISYQEFYGKPTPTEMLGGDLGAKFSADISGGSDPGYQSYMSALDEYDKKWNEMYGSIHNSTMYAPRVNYFGYLKGLKEGTTWAAPELKPPPTDPNEGNPLRKVPLETLLSNYVVSGREPGGLVADAIDWWKKQGKT